MLQLNLKNPGIFVVSLYRSFERAPPRARHLGVKVAFCSSVVGGSLAPPLSMLKNALVYQRGQQQAVNCNRDHDESF